MNHDKLVKEAEQLAKGLSIEQKTDLSFIWSFCGNHGLTALAREVKWMKWLLVMIGVPLLVAALKQLMIG